jgi:ribosomal protein S18 acetylase RimI-like enzyme
VTAVVEQLEWDSELWSRRVARVRPDAAERGTDGLVTAIRAACAGSDFVQVLVDVARTDQVRVAEDHGFRLVDVRCVVTLDRAVHLSSADVRHHIEPIGSDSLEDVAALAAECHTTSRFASDPDLDSSTTAELYRRWIHRDAASPGWSVAVATTAGTAAGYVTYGVDSDGVGTIGLVGVASSERGSGLGGALVDHAARACFADGAARMSVVTQAGNLPAMAVYRRAGFVVDELGLWLHWHRHPLTLPG